MKKVGSGSLNFPKFLTDLNLSLVFQKMKVPIGYPLTILSVSLADFFMSQKNSL